MSTYRTFLWFLVVFAFGFPVRGDQIRAGFATVDITPPVPYRMSGYFSERLSTGIQDPLQAKAVVFAHGDIQAAIVFCDLIGISPRVSSESRNQASAATGIPAANIAICATHSHTGPLYWGALRNFLHERTVTQQGRDIYEAVDYPTQLSEKLVAAITRAQSSLAPVRLNAGFATETRLAFNRRFHMKDGSVRFNPGQQNPDIGRVAGPIDPQVGLISISPAGGAEAAEKPSAAVVSYALHLDTVGGTEYSADYPKYVEDVLRSKQGPKFMSLFGTGTCGDINHIDVSIKTRRSAREIGTLLGETVAAGLDQLTEVAQPRFAVGSATVEVPLQQFSNERVARAREEMKFVDSGREMSFLDRVETYKINAIQLRNGPNIPLEVQVFCFSNDVAIVTLPGEVFVELGLAIKAASPFATTLVIELANDAPGYIPTRKAFAEGSYETVNSRVQSGGGELLVETTIRLLKELSSRH
jgi:hypothetical protein